MSKSQTHYKLSIIVPVYKTEKFLRKCVDSILKQTFSDFELILIDDGSPDNCPEICDEYAMVDCRIKVYHQENSGEGSVKKLGIELAIGEYIGFVDSDDWIAPEMFDLMYKAAKENDCDIAVCNLRIHDLQTNQIEDYNQRQFLKDNYVYDRSEIQEDVSPKVLLEQIRGYMCNKIYRADIFKQCSMNRAIGLPNNADWALTCEFFKKARRLIFINKCLYNYQLHQGGSLTGRYKDYFSIVRRLHEYRLAFLNEFNLDKRHDIKQECINRFINMSFFSAFEYEFLFSHTTSKEKIKRISTVLNNAEVRNYIDACSNLHKKQNVLGRIKWWLFLLRSPLLIYGFMNCLNLGRKIKRGFKKLGGLNVRSN